MTLAKKWVFGGGGFAIAIAAVIAFRTITFTPADIASADDIKLAAIPDFDIGAAANHLGAAVRFQTVSHQKIEENDVTQWTQLHDWMQETYPVAHGAMVRELVAKNTLVYTNLDDCKIPQL